MPTRSGFDALDQLAADVQTLQADLAVIKRALAGLAGSVSTSTPAAAGTAQPAKRHLRMTPALRKLRQAQGRYMGVLRRLNDAQKRKVQKLRQERGYEAALRLAESLPDKR